MTPPPVRINPLPPLVLLGLIVAAAVVPGSIAPRTAMHFAASYGDERGVRALMDSGANVCATTVNGYIASDMLSTKRDLMTVIVSILYMSCWFLRA